MNFTKHTSELTKLWESLFHPLNTPFYFPKEFVFFHEINSLEYFYEHSDDFFLKDGIMGLLPIIQLCFKTKINSKVKFRIAAFLAPLIPQEIRQHFYFFNFESSTNAHSRQPESLLLFLSAIDNFHNFSLIKKQLDQIHSPIKTINLYKNPLQELPYYYFFNKDYDLTNFIHLLDYLKSKFKNTEIRMHIAPQDLYAIDLNKTKFINTNHYFEYIGIDFLSYFYFFNTGVNRIGVELNNNYKKIKSDFLIKELFISYFEYSGPSIIDQNQINKLNSIYFPSPFENLKPTDFNSREILELVNQISINLFTYNKIESSI